MRNAQFPIAKMCAALRILSFCILMSAYVSVVAKPDSVRAPTDIAILDTVQRFYPEIFDRGLASDEMVGFVFDQELNLINRVRFKKASDTDFLGLLERSLRTPLREKVGVLEAACFPEVKGIHGNFCAMWVVLK